MFKTRKSILHFLYYSSYCWSTLWNYYSCFLVIRQNIKSIPDSLVFQNSGSRPRRPWRENNWDGYAITAHLIPKVSFQCWSTFWTLNLSHKICILLSAKYAPNRISLVHSRTAVCCFYTGTDGTIALQKYNNFRIQQNKTTIIFGGLQKSVYFCCQISFS